MKIVSWQPVLTDHQSHTLEALQRSANCELQVYVLSLVHAERKAQGWVSRHNESLNPRPLPVKGRFLFALRRLRENRDAIHLFGSPFERVSLVFILLAAVALGCRVYLVSEPYSPNAAGHQIDGQGLQTKLKAILRPCVYSLYGMLIARRVTGVFAISCLAVRQYRGIGIPEDKLFPFGYFVPKERDLPIDSAEAKGQRPLKLIFVGNLIMRKGLDVLMAAIQDLESRGTPVTLDVFGPGDPSRYAFNETSVRYRGQIQFGKAQAVIAGYDVLVLPSRFDGWGVVVNEALLAGVPAICSNAVGAGDLLGGIPCGTTFVSESPVDLANKLHQVSASPSLLFRWRQGAIEVAESILPQVAGQYMHEAIRRDAAAPKPKCPWYDCH